MLTRRKFISLAGAAGVILLPAGIASATHGPPGWCRKHPNDPRCSHSNPPPTPEPPPPDPFITYGPLAGDSRSLADRVQAVKDATVPRAVTHPGGSPTVVNPGDNYATKITTAGTNGVMWWTKGAYDIAAGLSPMAGQKWYLESAAGYSRTSADSVVLGGAGRETHCIGTGSNAGVEIRGGVVENFGTATEFMAVTASGGDGVYEDMIVRNNFSTGLGVARPNNVVRRVYLHNNGRYGPVATQHAVDNFYDNQLFENCRWSFNNTRFENPIDNAGGSKFLHSNRIQIKGCWAHDNYGFGIWLDLFTGQNEPTVVDCVAEHNSRAGIFVESPYGGSSVIRNYAIDNGYDTVNMVASNSMENNVQMRITNADQTIEVNRRGVIAGNYLDYSLAQGDNQGALLLLWNHDGQLGWCQNWDVYENQLWLRDTTNRVFGKVLLLDSSTASSPMIGDADIKWYRNDYRVFSNSVEYWGEVDPGTRTEDRVTWAEWQAGGRDVSSTRTLI